MANENELQIVLSLIDNASAELKKITNDVKKDTQDITKESDKASKSLKDGFKDASKELKDFRRAAYAVTIEIAFLTTAVKTWGNHNLETRDSLDKLGVNAKTLFAMFGSIFAPAINALSDVIQQNMAFLKGLFTTIQQGYTWLFEKISFGTQYLISFQAAFREGVGIAEANRIALNDAGHAVEEMSNKFKAAFTENIPQTDAMKTQLREMEDALEKINLQYLTGAISAQQYYNVISSNNVANFQNMNTQMQLMQQLAAQENMMRNKSLMDYQTDVQAKMGLMKTLQEYHHTVYSSMMDFTNTVIQKFSTGMTSALTSIIMGTKKASEAFKEFGIAMVTAIVEFVIQYGIQMLIAAALSKLIMASTIAEATAIATAWLPAAIFASIATMGGASAAGLAGFTTATAGGLIIGAAAILTSKAISFGGGATGGTGAGGGYQEGGWVGLKGPEIALVGERGPEYIIPNNRLGSMGNQTSIHIEINNPVVSSKDDIDYLTEEISRRLAREAERI